jgi:hypothetical protein
MNKLVSIPRHSLINIDHLMCLFIVGKLLLNRFIFVHLNADRAFELQNESLDDNNAKFDLGIIIIIIIRFVFCVGFKYYFVAVIMLQRVYALADNAIQAGNNN